MCSQTSQQCINEAEASHVGCCCGYNPVVTLGTTSAAPGTGTINGLAGATFESGGEATRVGRRVQSQTAFDICAEARRTSAGRIEEHQQVVRNLGAEDPQILDLLASQERGHRDRYP